MRTNLVQVLNFSRAVQIYDRHISDESIPSLPLTGYLLSGNTIATRLVDVHIASAQQPTSDI